MTKIIFFFGNWIPTFLLIGFISISIHVFEKPSHWPLIIFYIYFLPVIFYRIMYFIFPKKEGKFDVLSRQHLLWWYGVQFQNFYSRFSFLEELLRIVPMIYSNWLRLWGGKIGKFIFWSPKVLIADRGDIDIGNYCIVGFGAKFTSHLISKSHKKNVFLYSKITIGNEVVVGAESNIGPGVNIENNISIAALSTLLPFSSWKNSKEYTPKEN